MEESTTAQEGLKNDTVAKSDVKEDITAGEVGPREVEEKKEEGAAGPPLPPWRKFKKRAMEESSSSSRPSKVILEERGEAVPSLTPAVAATAHPRGPTPASELERTDVFEVDQTADSCLRRFGSFQPFEIVSGLEKLPPIAEWSKDNLPKLLQSKAPERMREGPFCEPSVVDELWQEKARMDNIFDRKQGRVYRRVRAQIFPSTISGSANVGLSNRAGDKLWEVLEALDIWPSVINLARTQESPSNEDEAEMTVRYVDVCGGPGAFSELVKNLGVRENVKTIGRGMSLKIDSTQTKEASCIWYQHLIDSDDFEAVWGPDGDGNVYSPANLAALEKSVEEIDERGAHLVMADGGFEVSVDKDGNHLENYQEIYSARIILSEVLTMVRACTKGGFLVCKLFDTFSAITASIIYVTTRLFDKCYIVKPQRSRVVNSERYLVGVGFKGRENPDYEVLTKAMEFCHSTCFTDDESPESIVPVRLMEGDRKFQISLSQSIRELALRQTRALDIVMNAVDDAVAWGKGNQRKGGKGKGRNWYGYH